MNNDPERYKITFETWDKVAALYQEKFMDLDLYNDTYDLFCEQISKTNPNVLEIGCGPGNITKYLLAKRPDIDILATDIAPNMITLAKKNNPTARFEVMDSRKIDELNMRFDAIICGFCIPYLSQEDVAKLITDCSDLLSENGVLYLSFVEGDYEKSGYQAGSSGDKAFFYYHSLEKLKAELEKNHFKNAHVIPIRYPKNGAADEIHTVVIIKK